MPNDQYQKGLANILNAFHASLAERRVAGAVVEHDGVEGKRQGVHIVVTVGAKSDGQYFEAQEIDDCGEAIDAPAALKVRMLISQFVR